MSKHTPGPWRATGRHVVAAETEDRLGMSVQIQQGNGDDNRANLRLIAAAPDLLAALTELNKMYARAWDEVNGGLHFSSESVRQFEIAHAAASAAIYKATR